MDKNVRHWHLYVLKLEDSKYYVGITSKSVEERYEEHIRGFGGAAWTRLHKPLGVHDQRDLGFISEKRAKNFEDRVTRKYIRKYGIDNVRGGDLSITEDMLVQFGYPITKRDWKTVKTVFYLLLMIITLTILAYIK